MRTNTESNIVEQNGLKFGKGEGVYYIGSIAIIYEKKKRANFKNVRKIAEGIYMGEI